jgi:hypothetical protein
MDTLKKMYLKESQTMYLIDNLFADLNRLDLENESLKQRQHWYKMALSASLAVVVIGIMIIIILSMRRLKVQKESE